MSDDVRIVGFDQNVPQWATEKTLEDVREIFRKSYALDKERTATLDAAFDEIQKTRTISTRYLDSINKSLKGGAVDTGFTAIKKKEAKAVQDSTDRIGELAGGATIAGVSLGGLTKHSGVLGGAMHLLSSKLSYGALIVTPVIGLITGLVSAVRETIGAFSEFHKVGILYNEGILTYRKNLADLGMSTKDMTEMVGKHARTISLVSIPRFMELGQTLNESNEQLYQLGLTAKDAMKYSAEHLEMQRLMGVFEFQDAQSLSRATMQTMQSLTAYTKIMNKSREEIIESQKSMLDSADFARLIASMEPELASQVQASFSNITGALAGSLPNEEAKRVADLLTDMISAPVLIASKSYSDLMKSGQHEFANALAAEAERVKQGGTTAAGAFQFVQNLVATAEASAQSGWQQYLSMVDDSAEMATFIGGSFVKAGREMNARLSNFEEEFGISRLDPRFMAELAKGITEEQKAATQTRDILDKLLEGWDYLKLQKTFQLLGADEGGVAGNIEKLNEGLGFLYDKLLAFQDFEFGSIQDNLGWFAGGLLAAAGGAMLLQKIIMGIGTWLTGAMAGLGAAGAGAGVLTAGKFLLKRIPLVMGAIAAVDGVRGFNADKDAGFIDRLGNAGSSALHGVTMGFAGSRPSEISERAKTTTPATPQSRRIQPPEQISQTEIDEAINSMTDDDLAPLLKSIAMASNAQLEKVSELVRLVRSGQTGITGQQYG